MDTLKVHADVPPLAIGQGNGHGNPLAKSLQLSVFGGFVNVLPSTGETFAIEAAASHYCEQCGCDTVPVPLSDPEQGWVPFPCHQSECVGCYQFENICSNCASCEDCCGCATCASCGEPTDETLCEGCEQCSSCCSCDVCVYCEHKFPYGLDWAGSRCDHCEQCGCSCSEDAAASGWRVKRAGWNVRNWSVGTNYESNPETEWWNAYGQRIDPVLAMSDFYLSEYVSAVLSTRLPAARHGRNNGLRSAYLLLQDARTLQSHLVNQLDEAFRQYAYLAIGGEVRHHPASEMPSHGRTNTWTWWADMGEKYGRTELIRDAIELFDDYGWSSGYGGEKWATAAKILLARETGELDARTFVDRCFTLQHNGGSFLDKLRWAQFAEIIDHRGWGEWPETEGGITFARYYNVSSMLEIGNAHAADSTDLETLMGYATPDARRLLYGLAGAYGHKMTDRERMSYQSWLEDHESDVAVWGEDD